MPPVKGANAAQAIRNAVVHGSALYNSGHHGECANLYHTTMHELMSSDIDASVKHHMASVLSAASSQHCEATRAWMLRRGMDQAYSRLVSK